MAFWKIMGFGFFIVGLSGDLVMSLPSTCEFPAIYNFGDSNSDTGGISAAFYAVPPPNGEAFFGKPFGRACDGRLLIDFVALYLQLPYLSPYLDSIGSDFRTGANFATGGLTIRPQNTSLFFGGLSPFSLDVQMAQFSQFKTRTHDLYNQVDSEHKWNLPKSEDFSKALYTFDIGQNDLSAGFQSKSYEQVRASIPDILDQFASAVQLLYQQGARAFWIHNTGPIGCLPFLLIYYGPKPPSLDANGCVKPKNEVAQEFNRQLKEKVTQLRAHLSDAALTYVDVYSAKYTLITDAKKQGFVDPLKFCCGHRSNDYQVNCGGKTIVNGTEIYGTSCGDPSNYISWDGVHYTDAANKWVAYHIFKGQLSDPAIDISQAYHKTM